MATATLAHGFANPVLETQAVFRAILDALSRPGLPVRLPSGIEPPAPLTPELAAIALTLADSDAPVWLDGPLAREDAVAQFLRFHTGAPVTADRREAAFALATSAADLPPFDSFAIGMDEYPDRSTTIVVAVDDLRGGPPLRLTGPGIRDEVVLRAALPGDFADRLRGNRRLFPRGVDCLLVAQDEIVGLTRSVSVA